MTRVGRLRRAGWARSTRIAAATAITVALVGILAGAFAVGAPRASATEYRYWTYWLGRSAGGWGFAPFGAGQPLPNGTLIGWRFEVSPVGGSSPPRVTTSFAVVCKGKTASAGHELIALVVDYGTAADAPPGEHPPRSIDEHCADLPVVGGRNATGSDVLNDYAPGAIWTAQGLICGIDGYPGPSSGCAVAVQPSPTAPARTSAPPSSHPSAGPTVAGSSAHPPAGTSGASGTGSASLPASSGQAKGASAGAAPATSPATAGAAAAGGSGPSAVAVGAGGVHPTGSATSFPWGPLVGAVLILAVGAAAIGRATRRRP